uniref:Receptor ligand binding region domain-containing protein n=1 Tax=Acrobeloides nanus TaxID=290746 RepID=A0A914CP58_9BILA
MVYKRNIGNESYDGWKTILNKMKTAARIIVACFELSDDPNINDRRNFLLAMSELDNWDQNVLSRIEQWPFYCQGCATYSNSASLQAMLLADAFYLWALTANRTIALQGNISDGNALCANAKGTFDGFSGKVVIDENGNRLPIYRLYGKSDGAENDRITFVVIETNGNNTAWKPQYANEYTTIWKNWGGRRPRSRPICDFDGSACPVPFVQQYLGVVIAVVIIGCGLICGALGLIYYVYRVKQNEKVKLDLQWQIPFMTLQKPKEKGEFTKSMRSITSSHSSTTSTRMTMENKHDSDRHKYYYLNSDSIVAKVHKTKPVLTNSDFVELRFVIQFLKLGSALENLDENFGT